jgi:hypothetical protein
MPTTFQNMEAHLTGNTYDNLPDGIYVHNIPGREYKPYPAWRYHEWLEPIIVQGTEEDERAKEGGWIEHNKPITASRCLLNQRFDLEDMSARQLAQYAKDEFGVDLPVEAGKEKLFKSIWKMSINAPENRDRVVLMAHSLEMNYDETQAQILKQIRNAEDVTTEEFWA